MFVISSLLIFLLLLIIIFARKQVEKNTKIWILITSILLILLNYLFFGFNPIEILLILIVLTYIFIRRQINKKQRKKFI